MFTKARADPTEQPHLTLSPPPAQLSITALYLGAITAYLVAAGSALLAVSYLACLVPQVSTLPYLQPLCDDSHYKYLVPLLVPTTAWFVIANWVGWEYFRNA